MAYGEHLLIWFLSYVYRSYYFRINQSHRTLVFWILFLEKRLTMKWLWRLNVKSYNKHKFISFQLIYCLFYWKMKITNQIFYVYAIKDKILIFGCTLKTKTKKLFRCIQFVYACMAAFIWPLYTEHEYHLIVRTSYVVYMWN